MFRTKILTLSFFALCLTGCQSYKVVMDSEYSPRKDSKKKVSVLGVIAPSNDSNGFYGFGHTHASDIEQETLNLLADKVQRYFNESPFFTTYDKIDLERLVKTQKLQSSDLFDRTSEILPVVGELQTIDCIIIARITQNYSMLYLPPVWWHTIQIEMKMVDVRTGQIYLSGYSGGRWLLTFSRELLFEDILEEMFKHLSNKMILQEKNGFTGKNKLDSLLEEESRPSSS